MTWFAVFLVLASFAVFAPSAFGSCVLLPCDDANIKLGEPIYRFIDFSYQNKVGDPITFILEKTAQDQCNSYVATITNEKDETVWEQTEASFCVIVPDQNLITSQIKLGYDPDNKIIMFESAKYLLRVQIDDGSIEREFVSRHNFSSISLDRTVYPVKWAFSPLKQFDSGVPFDEIYCKHDLMLVQKYDGSPVCVTEPTKQKLVERGWIAKDDSILKTSTNCMTLEQNKETAPFFKTPAYLPEGYSHVCSQSGTPSESYIIYHHNEILNWNIPELVSDGAIFIYQIDERSILDEEKLETLGTSEQRIQEDYDSVMKGNPSLKPQLIRINGMLAYASDSCIDCGIQTANFTDGTFIQKSTFTETKIKFIDENGINYMLQAALPLDELILVAESLQ